MRIAVVAPVWFRVPPTGYGGIEWVVSLLADGLVASGHDVTLYATGDSATTAQLVSVYPEARPEELGRSVPELRHVLGCYAEPRPFDVISDQTGGFLAGALSATVAAPVVHTVHGRLGPEERELYRAVGQLAPRLGLVSVSQDQQRSFPDANWIGVCHNAIDLESYRFSPDPGDYLAFVGRMAADKGPHRAIETARALGLPLRLAGKLRSEDERRYFDAFVRPRLGGDVDYLGEVTHEEKVDLLAGARATLFPIEWDEPFGLVMIESMACGTPVVATRRGAVPEVVPDGVAGIVVDDWDLSSSAAVERSLTLSRTACRAHVAEHFSREQMVAAYLSVFRKVAR